MNRIDICLDNVDNVLNLEDEVLVRVPKSDKTYRRAIIKGFKDIRESGFCQVLVEYDDGRLYCNQEHWKQKSHGLKFTTKLIKTWRYSSDIIKLKQEYID